jgi:riboflavin biosynthesis pyrimidine reductase
MSAATLIDAAPIAQLAPLETLYDDGAGVEVPLPAGLRTLYGPLRFPKHGREPYVIGNLVSSLDGVVALGVPGRSNGKEISGFNPHDRMIMGLLRAVADVVVVGAGTLRHGPGVPRTAEHVFPPAADEYQDLRYAQGKPASPLNVIVTATGEIDPAARIFGGERSVIAGGEVPVLVVTTEAGARHAKELGLPGSVALVAAGSGSGSITASEILGAIPGRWAGGIVLVEGGPRLLGTFLGEGRLDEQFLTLSPQIAGRDGAHARLGLVEGIEFAPDRPLWGTLVSAKRARSHLFLRYSFGGEPDFERRT